MIMQNKYGEFYLKKVYLILSHGRRLSGFVGLVSELKGKGISCEAMLPEEGYPSAQDALYITDCRETVMRLTTEELPVAVYLHPGNRQEDLSAAWYAFEEPQSLDAEYVERVYRRYRDIPWDILETERCYLRETVPDDVDAFYEIYSAPEMTRYTEDLYESKISERAYIREYVEKIYHYFEFGVWTVILKETGEIVGRAGLNVREGYDMPELGYVIGQPWQGRGLATEVCRGILEYATTVFGFPRVMTLIQTENEMSLHVAKKLGFRVQESLTRKETAKDMSTEKEINYWLLIWQAPEEETMFEKGDADVYSGQ